MEIEYNDGSILTCNSIIISGRELIADDIYSVPLDEVKEIRSL